MLHALGVARSNHAKTRLIGAGHELSQSRQHQRRTGLAGSRRPGPDDGGYGPSCARGSADTRANLFREKGQGARGDGAAIRARTARPSSRPTCRTLPRPKPPAGHRRFSTVSRSMTSIAAAMADGLDVVRALADPVGTGDGALDPAERHAIERVRVPLGVVGVIYESRPNVTADAAALCLKAGNAVDPARRVRQLPHEPRHPRGARRGLARRRPARGRDRLVPTRDRAAVGHDAGGPRRRDRRHRAARRQEPGRHACRRRRACRCSRISKASAMSMSTRRADLEMAKAIVLNAKMRRTGVCGAAETLLVDRAAAPTHLQPLVAMLLDAGCEVRGDEASARPMRASSRPATRTGRPNISTRSSPPRSSTASTARSRISSATARTTPTRS